MDVHYFSVKGFRTISVPRMLRGMAAPYVRTQIRIPQELYDKLQESAEASARSFNAEMVVRLESSFRLGAAQEQERPLDPNAVMLRPFQRDLFERIRKVVRFEALLGAPKLTAEQKSELEDLRRDLEST